MIAMADEGLGDPREPRRVELPETAGAHHVGELIGTDSHISFLLDGNRSESRKKHIVPTMVY